ncbi:Cell division protein FtsI [Peptidoglycan synthetase] [Chitinispirillum alkaliphilum]|nr:Cell division protein FtsI [Peptidoglycan synthetase] [Chitinispirillum alkaliphilum]
MKESPMLRHMRSPAPKKKRSRIPKKGRIRAVLILIAAIFAVRSGPNIGVPSCEEPLKKVVVPKTLSYDQVSNLLEESDTPINQPFSTIVQDSDTLTLSLSIDTTLQNLAVRLMNRYKPRYGSVVVLDPVTGRVLALHSYTNKGEKNRGNKLFTSSIFPAASVFKAITAAAVIEDGNLTPQSNIPHVGRNHTLYRNQLNETLHNYTEITLRSAFARSINPAFGRIALFNTEQGALTEFGNRFGFNQQVPFELPVEISQMLDVDTGFGLAELASGFNRTTTISPIHGALIAAAISEDGRMPKPTIVDSIHSAFRDTILYKAEPQTWLTSINPTTASYLRDLMISVPVSGTARRTFRTIRQSPRFNEFEYGGKTGNITHREIGRTDWFVGFTRHPSNIDQRIAVSVVCAHGPYWTVHSSFIAAEIMRIYMRNAQDQAAEKLLAEAQYDSD